VVFPWNYVEDMCNIVPKAAEGGASLEEVKERLKRNHSLDVDTEEISRILDEVKRRST